MPTRRRLSLLSLVIALVVTSDQLAKAAARAYLAPRPPISLVGGIVQFVYSENVGAFLGLGAELPPALRILLFGIMAGLMTLAVAVYTLVARGLTRAEVAAASLVVAGGISNLMDRAVHQGRVTDFVSVGIGPLRTGIFNVADVAILAGVGWFVVLYALGVPGRGQPGRDSGEGS